MGYLAHGHVSGGADRTRQVHSVTLMRSDVGVFQEFPWWSRVFLAAQEPRLDVPGRPMQLNHRVSRLETWSALPAAAGPFSKPHEMGANRDEMVSQAGSVRAMVLPAERPLVVEHVVLALQRIGLIL